MISWMRMRVLHDLEADNRADGGTGHHVARPMLIVVHAREAHQCRAPVKRGSDVETCMRPPELRLASHRCCEGKGRNRMSRWEGSILVAPETSPELEAVRILDVDERPLSSGNQLYSTAKNVSEQNRLEA